MIHSRNHRQSPLAPFLPPPGLEKCLQTEGLCPRRLRGYTACGIAEALDTENMRVRLHSGAARCMLCISRDLKTEGLT